MLWVMEPCDRRIVDPSPPRRRDPVRLGDRHVPILSEEFEWTYGSEGKTRSPATEVVLSRLRQAVLCSWTDRRLSTELGFQVPVANASLYTLASALIRSTANECERNTDEFCESGLNAPASGRSHERMHQDMVGTFGTFHYTQDHLMQRYRMLSIRIARESLFRIAMDRSLMAPFNLPTCPVVAHVHSLVPSVVNSTFPACHIRASRVHAQKSRPAYCFDTWTLNGEGTSLLAGNTVREYPTTRGAVGLPLAANASLRSTSVRYPDQRRLLK
jgi:hypothetical protein